MGRLKSKDGKNQRRDRNEIKKRKSQKKKSRCAKRYWVVDLTRLI